MHKKFEKAFEASKKRDFITARELYQDLFLDIKTYSDYYLLKEIIFLLNQRIEQHNIDHHFDLLEHAKALNFQLVEDPNEIKKYLHPKEVFTIKKIILIHKGLFKSSYIGINEDLGKMSIHYYMGKGNIDIFYIPMDYYYFINFNYHLCGYEAGCKINRLSPNAISRELNELIPFLNQILFEYHLREEIVLLEEEKIHKWYKMMCKEAKVDIKHLEYADFGNFSFDENTKIEIEKTFKLVAPLMWLSNQNDSKIPINDLQFDLIGNKWGSHKTINEFVAILKTLPLIDFGKSVFIHSDSYYLPYENNYYITRNITRLEHDQNID